MVGFVWVLVSKTKHTKQNVTKRNANQKSKYAIRWFHHWLFASHIMEIMIFFQIINLTIIITHASLFSGIFFPFAFICVKKKITKIKQFHLKVIWFYCIILFSHNHFFFFVCLNIFGVMFVFSLLPFKNTKKKACEEFVFFSNFKQINSFSLI